MISRGFTLIELLVTLAVAIILATVAVPNFQGLIDSSRESSNYNEILSGLKHARAEAIKCRSEVTFSIVGDSGWSYEVTHTGSGDCNMRSIQRESEQGSVSDAAIAFDALGKSSCPQGSACEIEVDTRTLYIYSTGYIGSVGS